MRRFPIPLSAALLSALGVALAAIGALRLGIPVSAAPTPRIDVETADAPDLLKPLIYHDDRRAYGGAQVVLQRSPFLEDRSVFRVEVAKALTVGQSQVSAFPPRFLGTVGDARGRRALIVLAPNEPAKAYNAGDVIPNGRIVSVNETSLTLEQFGETRILKLFD